MVGMGRIANSPGRRDTNTNPGAELFEQIEPLLRWTGFHIRDGVCGPCQQITDTEGSAHGRREEAQAEIKRSRNRRKSGLVELCIARCQPSA